MTPQHDATVGCLEAVPRAGAVGGDRCPLRGSNPLSISPCPVGTAEGRCSPHSSPCCALGTQTSWGCLLGQDGARTLHKGGFWGAGWL